MKTLRTLCSGGELFGVGARQAGWRHVDGYEIDPKIAAVARLNGFDVRAADVCEVDYAALPAVDHLHVSPSCTNASQANQKGRDENGDPLPRETDVDRAVADATCRAIAAHTGDTFTLENVWGYRTFESFEKIRAVLVDQGFSYDYWHLNSADYGVPQTRKRLVLIARRGLCRITRPHPTHRDGGDMFHAPWVGWYSAIADILDTLPPTRPAPWQEARMPKAMLESTLIGPAGYDGTVVQSGEHKPSFTVTAAGNHAQWRAWLVESKNSNQQYGDGLREMHEPATTVVTDHKPSHQPKAFIVGGGNTQLAQIDSYARPADRPMFTVGAGDGARKAAAAFLIGDQSGSQGDGVQIRDADEPAMSIRAGRPAIPPRAYVGRWVRMTIQALGRFQTVPDDYQGLTSKINGNGVPCELARQIMEGL